MAKWRQQRRMKKKTPVPRHISQWDTGDGVLMRSNHASKLYSSSSSETRRALLRWGEDGETSASLLLVLGASLESGYMSMSQVGGPFLTQGRFLVFLGGEFSLSQSLSLNHQPFNSEHQAVLDSFFDDLLNCILPFKILEGIGEGGVHIITTLQ